MAGHNGKSTAAANNALHKSSKAMTWVKVKNPKAPSYLSHVNGEW